MPPSSRDQISTSESGGYMHMILLRNGQTRELALPLALPSSCATNTLEHNGCYWHFVGFLDMLCTSATMRKVLEEISLCTASHLRRLKQECSGPPSSITVSG
mmetsp:Transcript_48316/g.108853  ORF Transcript_48316/g.108853 Transcript_48316/m.108853 type:complete len:102 (-) Transcript_48316:426-731(-)